MNNVCTKMRRRGAVGEAARIEWNNICDTECMNIVNQNSNSNKNGPVVFATVGDVMKKNGNKHKVNVVFGFIYAVSIVAGFAFVLNDVLVPGAVCIGIAAASILPAFMKGGKK